jgi:serine/threonine protein kinase
MTNQNPTVINDRYELGQRIGRGGMADVFLARDLLLDRQVALKVLFPEHAIDPNFVERFRREAQSVAGLNHPNIVAVYDWGQYSNTYFMAMEYVEGRTLADILRAEKQLSSAQASDIASEVAFRRFGLEVEAEEPLASIQHVFTHFKLEILPQPLQVINSPRQTNMPNIVWLAVEDAIGAALPTPVRNILLNLKR